MKKLSETYTELGIDFEFPIEVKNAKGDRIYYEESTGDRERWKYDDSGNVTYRESSVKHGLLRRRRWWKSEYDSNGNLTFFENSEGGWYRCEYDANGNRTYYHNSANRWKRWKYDANGNQTDYWNSADYRSWREYDADGNETYYGNNLGEERGIPKSAKA